MTKLVAIESPLKGDIQRNQEFCKNVCRFAIMNGFNPFAMHLFFTQFLDDTIEEERNLGIKSGLAWTDKAQEVWFCLRPEDRFTVGMNKALLRNNFLKKMKSDRKIRFLTFTQEGNFLGKIISIKNVTFLKRTKLKKSDHYLSTCGRIEQCPCPGLMTNPKADVLWFRPIIFKK